MKGNLFFILSLCLQISKSSGSSYGNSSTKLQSKLLEPLVGNVGKDKVGPNTLGQGKSLDPCTDHLKLDSVRPGSNDSSGEAIHANTDFDDEGSEASNPDIRASTYVEKKYSENEALLPLCKEDWDSTVQRDEETETEVNHLIYGGKKVNYIRMRYHCYLHKRNQEMTVVPPLLIDIQSPFFVEADKLAKGLLKYSIAKGSGIGRLAATDDTGLQDYTFTFVRLITSNSDNLNEEVKNLAQGSEELKNNFDSALKEIYQDSTGQLALDFEIMNPNHPNYVDTTALYDPDLTITIDGVNCAVTRRKLCINDLNTITHPLNKGVAVGQATDDVNGVTVVVFLHYGQAHKMLAAIDRETPNPTYIIRSIVADLAADELAEKMSTDKRITEEIVLDQNNFGLTKRCSVAYCWMEDKADVTTFVDGLRAPVLPVVSGTIDPVLENKVTEPTGSTAETSGNTQQPPKRNLDEMKEKSFSPEFVFKNDDAFSWETSKTTNFLRIRKGLNGKQVLENRENGTGIGTSSVLVQGKRLFVLVCFGTRHFKFGDVMENLSNQRQNMGLDAIELDFIKCAQLDTRAGAVLEGVELPEKDDAEFGKGNVVWNDFTGIYIHTAANENSTESDQVTALIDRVFFPTKGATDIEVAPASIFNNISLSYKTGNTFGEVKNVKFLGDVVHILDDHLKGIGIAATKSKGKLIVALIFEVPPAELKNEGIHRGTSLVPNNETIARYSPASLAMEFLFRQLAFSCQMTFETSSQGNVAAKTLALELLAQRVEFSGSGFGRFAPPDGSTRAVKFDFEAIFIKLAHTQVPSPRHLCGDKFEESLKQNALRIAVKTLCRDGVMPTHSEFKDKGSNVVSMRAGSPTPKFYQPNLDHKFTNFIIMRQGIFSMDFDMLASVSNAFGIAVERGVSEVDERGTKTHAPFIVVFVFARKEPFTARPEYETSQTVLKSVFNKDVGIAKYDHYSILKSYCTFALAEDFLEKCAANDQCGPEGFGAGNGFTVLHTVTSASLGKLENERKRRTLFSALKTMMTNESDETNEKTKTKEIRVDDYKFDFDWKTKYPVKTFIPLSARRTPWDRIMKDRVSIVKGELGAAIQVLKCGLLYRIALVFTPETPLSLDVSSQINGLRNATMLPKNYFLLSTNVYGSALNMLSREVLHSVQSLGPNSNFSAFGRGNQFTSILWRMPLVEGVTFSNSEAFSLLFAKFLSYREKFYDKTSLPKMLEYVEPNKIDFKTNIKFLPVWTQSSKWDILQLFADDTLGMGFWAEKINGSLHMSVVFYSSSRFLKSNILSKINFSRKNWKLSAESYISPPLTTVAREISKLLIDSGRTVGHGIGGFFKATYKTFYPAGGVSETEYLKNGLETIVHEMLVLPKEEVRPVDILKSNFNFTWNGQLPEAHKTFTPVCDHHRCVGDINEIFLQTTTELGIVAEILENGILIVLVIPINRQYVSDTMKAYFSKLARQLPFTRTSSLATTLDVTAARVCEKLGFTVNIPMEGYSEGAEFLAFYKKFEHTNDEVVEEFVTNLFTPKMEQPELLDYVEEADDFVWQTKNCKLSQMLPRWKKTSPWTYHMLVSPRATEIGIWVDVANKIMVALAYVPSILEGPMRENFFPKTEPAEKNELPAFSNVSVSYSILAHELALKQLRKPNFMGGVGAGTGFICASKRVVIGDRELPQSRVILELECFLAQLGKTINRDYGVEIQNKNGVEVNPLHTSIFEPSFRWDTETMSTFVPLSDKINRLGICQCILSGTGPIGFSVAIDKEHGVLLLVVLTQWFNKSPVMKFVLDEIHTTKPINQEKCLTNALHFTAMQLRQTLETPRVDDSIGWTAVVRKGFKNANPVNLELSEPFEKFLRSATALILEKDEKKYTNTETAEDNEDLGLSILSSKHCRSQKSNIILEAKQVGIYADEYSLIFVYPCIPFNAEHLA